MMVGKSKTHLTLLSKYPNILAGLTLTYKIQPVVKKYTFRFFWNFLYILHTSSKLAVSREL